MVADTQSTLRVVRMSQMEDLPSDGSVICHVHLIIKFYLSDIFRKSVRQCLWFSSPFPEWLTLVSIQGKLPSPPTKHSTLFYTPNLKHECGILFKMCPSDFRLVSYPQTKGSWKLSDVICPGQWPDTAAQFPPEPVATWGQGQAVHFATIGLSQRSYFSNRYESQFQQKVEIRHQIPPEI